MAKVATAVLEIRTDTGQVKGDLGALEKSGAKLAQTFQQQAGVMSKGFSDFGSQVSRVQSLVKEFSGQRAIQEAHAVAKAVQEIGGASKLTAEQQRSVSVVMASALQAHKVRGDEASASIKNLAAETNKASTASQGFGSWIGKANGMLAAFGVSLSAAALVGFGKRLLDDTGRIEDLHQATDVSRQALQQLGYIGSEIGVDMDGMGKAVSNLADRLASGDGNATKAVQMLGLSVKQLRDAGPLEAFLQIAEGAGRVEDPMTKLQLASDLFGDKLGKKLIPLLGDLRQKMNDVPKGDLISDKDIQDADALGDAIGHLTTKFEAYTFRVIRWFKDHPVNGSGPTIQQQLDALDYGKRLNIVGPENMPDKGSDISLPVNPKALSQTEMLANRLKQLRTDAMEPLSAMQKQWIADLQKWGESEGEIAKLVKASETAVHLYAEALKKGQEATKKQAEENKKLAEAIAKLGDVQRDAFASERFVGPDAGAFNAKGFLDGIEKVGDTTAAELDGLNKFFTEIGGDIRVVGAELVKTFDREYRINIRRGIDAIEAGNLLPKTGPGRTVIPEIRIQDASRLLPQFDAPALAIGKRLSLGINEGMKDLPKILIQALTGGGGVKNSIAALGTNITDKLFGEGGTLAKATSGLSNKLGGLLSKGLGSAMGGALSSVVSGMLPGVGALVGPLIDKIMSIGGPSKQEVEGRGLEKKFQDQFKSFGDMVNSIGAAYTATGKTLQQARADVDSLLAAEKKGPEAVQAIIDKLQDSLDQAKAIDAAISGLGIKSRDELQRAADIAREAYDKVAAGVLTGKYTAEDATKAYRAYQQALADMGDEQAKAWLKAHVAVEDAMKATSAAMSKTEGELNDMLKEREGLAKGIADEADEAEKGVIQKNQEAELKVLDAQIQNKADQYAQLAKDTGQEMADAIVEALKKIKIEPLRVDVIPTVQSPAPGGYAPPTWPGGEAPEPQAAGSYIRGITRPRTFLVGEAGSEDAVFGGAGRDLAKDVAAALMPALSGMNTGGAMTIRVPVYLDGRVLTETVVTKVSQDKYGTGTKLRRGLGI